jgi:two-component system, NtrC family, sensor kinase
MGIVSTIPEKCRRCYACVRECPVKAIKVIAGQATVIAELCIACGSCVKVCTQKAKRIEDATLVVSRMLKGDGPVFACVAPSYPVAFSGAGPGQVAAALRRLGFAQVWEVAFGAELVAREYGRLARNAARNGSPVVSTPCPAIVSYVTKYMPALHPSLAPIASPMVATARAIKARHGDAARVVFIGPCIAKKAEIRDSQVQGAVDAVLTFDEVQSLLAAAGIDPAREPSADFDGPSAFLGRSIPLSGGLLRAAGFDADILQNTVLVTEGKDRVLPALRELAEGKSKARVLDVLFCEGCINGPKMTSAVSVFARKEMLADHVNECNRDRAGHDIGETLAEHDAVDVSRGFSSQAVVLPQPTEAEIAEALARMRKYGPEDQLNCGSCGYPSCRDKAIAVCQGLAEVGMCLPYLVEELESTLATLQRSHQAAQDRLVQTERLASMGQISAGVAHEINNPLSTILLYSSMLLKAHREGDPESEDIQMIVSEANRCRSIMRGLLDFARQSRVVRAPTDLGGLVAGVVSSLRLKYAEKPVRISATVQEGMPPLPLDAEQIRQMLVNLVQNGVDAVESVGAVPGAGAGAEAAAGGGAGSASPTGGAAGACPDGARVAIDARLSERGDTLELRVTDNGCGMPPETAREIFTPFYTTKSLGQGTGMGLSIVFGVVKMHAGDIAVDSAVGRGTEFRVRIPVGEMAGGGNP